MEKQQGRGFQGNATSQHARRAHEQGAYTGDNPNVNAQVGSSLLATIQDEDLMPSQHGFGDDGTKATRFHKADDGDDQMKEKGQDVSFYRPIVIGVRDPA